MFALVLLLGFESDFFCTGFAYNGKVWATKRRLFHTPNHAKPMHLLKSTRESSSSNDVPDHYLASLQ